MTSKRLDDAENVAGEPSPFSRAYGGAFLRLTTEHYGSLSFHLCENRVMALLLSTEKMK